MKAPLLFPALIPLGWNARLAQAWATLPGIPSGVPARVVRVSHRDVRIDMGDGPCAAATRGVAARGEPLAVGDWVRVAPVDHGPSVIDARLEHRGELARVTPGGARQVLARNVDVALIVMGLDGDWNPRRVERYLALARHAQVRPLIVLSKADAHPDAAQRASSLSRRVGAATPVLALDGRAPASRAALAPWLGAGQTVVMLGSSGAGKSTLVNTLFGAEVAATRAVREDDARGRHTTTARELRSLPQGACLIDTPGLRGLLLDVDGDDVQALFEDIATLAERCRFRDCRHEREPGCAVRGVVDDDRLENARKLGREAARLSDDPRALRERRAAERLGGRLIRARLKDKGRK